MDWYLPITFVSCLSLFTLSSLWQPLFLFKYKVPRNATESRLKTSEGPQLVDSKLDSKPVSDILQETSFNLHIRLIFEKWDY